MPECFEFEKVQAGSLEYLKQRRLKEIKGIAAF